MEPPESAASGGIIAVDWGTSNVRAMLLDKTGAVMSEASSGAGIGTLDGGHEAAFERLAQNWPPVPAILGGMIGSRQGWREAPYLSCPARSGDVAAQVLRFRTAAGRPIAIVPGLVLRSSDRDGDVIRGEETQIIGLLARDPGFDGTVVLPGTHSKWVAVCEDVIATFQTFLSGEIFDLLAHRSFLRHSVAKDGGDLWASPGFALGIERTVEARLPFLSAIFSVRVRHLLDNVSRGDNLAYLCGLVIGGEISAALAGDVFRPDRPIRIVGSPSLAETYGAALRIAGYQAEALSGTDMAVAGLVSLARTVGFLKPEPVT